MGFLFLSLLVSVFADFEGQKILRCSYDNPKSIHILEAHVDVQAVLPGNVVDIRLEKSSDMDFIKKYTTDCEVTADLDAEYAKWEAAHLAARNNASAGWFDAYHDLAEIQEWTANLANEYPGLATYVDAVKPEFETWHGRKLFGVRIFDRTDDHARQPQRRIFMTGQIHAREWISSATLQYVLYDLLNNYSRGDPAIVGLLRGLEIVALPVINPDGYDYTWTSAPNARNWRKNRRENVNSNCYGTDENRNYDDMWGKGGSSSDPCSDTFMGPSPASEPEVKTVQSYFIDLQQSTPFAPTVAAIDWHSYGQLILRPYGNNNTLCDDEDRLRQLGDNYREDILKSGGVPYTSQRSYQLYQTSGTTSDWYYGEQAFASNGGYRVAGYTIELRPTGSPGFQLPPSQIIPTGMENSAAFRNFAIDINSNPIFRP